MIPWQHFQPGYSLPQSDQVWGVDLLEEYLHFVETGPSMAEVVFKCPMPEVAQERRFMITQQGGDSAEFESEHIRRINACLTDLDQHFTKHATDEAFQAETPPDVDHVGLWTGAETCDGASISAKIESSLVPIYYERARPSLSLAKAEATDTHPSKARPDIPDDIASGYMDEEDRFALRSFLTNQHHRSARAVSAGAARARKPIKLRRRDRLQSSRDFKSSILSSHFCAPSHDRLGGSFGASPLAFAPT